MRSPRRLEAVVRAYFDTTCIYAVSSADAVARTLGGYPTLQKQRIYDLPVVRRFRRDPEPRQTRYGETRR